MIKGVNKVLIIGNLGRDPEVRYAQNGAAVANVTVATTETWKDKSTGQQQEHTEWHKIVFYQKLAEIVGKYLRKGSKIYIEGHLKTRKWQDKTTGQDKYTTEIIAENLQMLDGKSKSQETEPVYYVGIAANGTDDTKYHKEEIDPEFPF